MSFIRRVPLPMSALALGLAALGNLLLPYSPAVRAACGLAAAVVACFVALRIVLDLSGVRAELRNPAALAGLPAFFMALMVLSTYVKPYAPIPAKGLWVAALVLQLLVTAVFMTRHVVPFSVSKALPGWFLIFVGFVVASVTSPAFDVQPVGRLLLYAGVIGYVAVMPVIAYRMLKGGALPAPALPTVAMFAAPPSLLLVGYLAVSQVRQTAVIYVLLAIVAASLLYVLTSLPRIIGGGFHPSYAALTFPVVISAIALKQSNLFLAGTATGPVIPKVGIVAMDVFATAMVLFVMAHYAVHFVTVPAED